jgi:hypothetical protein
VVIIRDFAYPEHDPRHHGKRLPPKPSRPSVTDTSFFGAPEVEQEDEPMSSSDALLAAFHAAYGDQLEDTSNVSNTSTTHAAPPPSTASLGGLQVDGERQDEYTGPAKAICDFTAQDPKDVHFREGEECWVRYQSQEGLLLVHKDGRDCLVSERHLEFTNHG